MITVVIPASPIKSHPDTAVLEETLESVRHHLPDAEIILTFDGIRAEQEHRRPDYDEHIRRILWMADHKYHQVLPLLFPDHMHQTGMLRDALAEVTTPLILYVEQDTPLVTDRPINWTDIAKFIASGESNLVRFHHEAVIPQEHQHMMHGREGTSILPYIRTSQWSQRPHLASVAYYRRILGSHFTPEAKCFIEDKMHSVLSEAFVLDGEAGWLQHRVHIYAPTDNLRYTYHTDGRQGEAKYDDTQVF